MVQILPSNTFTTAKWIVSATASDGTHTTIAAALTSASSGDTIFIRPGTYTENLTLKAGVTLTTFSGDGDTPNVTIIGKATFSAAGTVTISNIRLQTNSDFFLVNSGSAASIVNLEYCYLNCSNNTGISFTTSNTAAVIAANYCQGNLGTTDIALYSMSSTGTLNFIRSIINNSGSSLTAASNSAGVVQFIYSYYTAVLSTTSAGVIGLQYSIISASALNTTAVTLAGTGSSSAFYSLLFGGTASSVSAGSGTSMGLTLCTLQSSNTNNVTGAGTINEAMNRYTTSFGNNATTQIYGYIKGSGTSTAPSAGSIGEQVRATVTQASAITLTNNIAANVTSISLTAGIWDVTGLACYSGTLTGTSSQVSVNTTSATNGTPGDNFAYIPSVSTAFSDMSVTIPSWRLSLASTTTVYLIATVGFSVGTAKAYGRISATRVA